MLKMVLSLLGEAANKLGLGNYKYGVAALVGGIMFILWLIPTVVGGFFDLVWFVIKLPFRLVWLVLVDGLWAFLKLLWGLFTGFFGLFGIVGTVLQWLIVAAAVIGAGIFLLLYFFEDKPADGAKAAQGPQKEQSESVPPQQETLTEDLGFDEIPEKEAPARRSYDEVPKHRPYFRPMPRFGQRKWALEVLGIDKSADKDEIKKRYRELLKQYHPDRLPADTPPEAVKRAVNCMELIHEAYDLLMEI